jgi:hypothetical protein
MKKTSYLPLLFICIFGWRTDVQAQSNSHNASIAPFPCRIHDSDNSDLFITTLGDVRTPLAQGVFDPEMDRVNLNGGTAIDDYYKDSLGIKFYAPIDKSVFATPPSGWCSWYYYYQEFTENDIKENARWLAENLKDYGAAYVQIDDGWQGRGHGMGDNRDWTTVNDRFPHGMDSLASFIKSMGFKAGLWLAPHGQSRATTPKDFPEAFLLKSGDSSASQTWEGDFLVDPTSPAAKDYFKKLFTTLTGWGYDYFKIDGQPIVIDEYTNRRSYMKDSTVDPLVAYRGTLQTIHATIGHDRYLLGCWGIPLAGTGIMNGSRTGGDVLAAWSGFETALDATMQYYFLHNVVWYCDPDCMLLRSPLTLDQARAWATLQGLTGEALMTSERLADLSPERVEILRAVYPALDIRPLDLFPAKKNKRIWDLKINHLGRNYDVVGVFNFRHDKSDMVLLTWKDLGLPDTGAVHVFDFWNKEYLGAWEKGMVVEIPPTACRVLTLVPDNQSIQLVSTSRHITQGYLDLSNLNFDATHATYSGTSSVVKNDPYELRFAFPRGKNFIITSASAGDLPVKVSNHQGWATVEFTSGETKSANWQVTFAPAEYYHFPESSPGDIGVEPIGLDGVNLRWDDQYYLSGGFNVYLDSVLLGHAQNAVFPLRKLDPLATYTAQVRTVWEDGIESKKTGGVKFSLRSMLPDELYLSEIDPERATIGWGSIGTNRSVTDNAISINGKKYRYGIGTHANSDIEYDLHGMYGSFTSTVGIDDGNNYNGGSVEFYVIADGKTLWTSGIVNKGDATKTIKLDISGVRHLLLRVTAAGKSIDYDHADWADAKISKR